MFVIIILTVLIFGKIFIQQSFVQTKKDGISFFDHVRQHISRLASASAVNAGNAVNAINAA